MHGGLRQPTDHISYHEQFGFSGITAGDKEHWLRKYPHIKDFDTTIAEMTAWLSEHFSNAFRAKHNPRGLLDWWLAGDWISVSGYREPKIIYNPEQLSTLIEEYFKNDGLIERLTRGKCEGFGDTLAARYHEKALGHAVKLREVVSEFPRTPETTGKPRADLRRLQEWCVECEVVSRDLYAKVTKKDVDAPLELLGELSELLESGFPKIDEAAGRECRARVRDEIERLLKAIGELGEPNPAFSVIPARDLKSKAKRWLNCVNGDGKYEALLEKMRKHGLRVPSDRTELTEMLWAAELMAAVDWDKIREIEDAREHEPVGRMPIDDLTRQMHILQPAQSAEDSITSLTWRRYCQENLDYDEAFRKASERVASLFNDTAAAVNSQPDLLKIQHLRGAKLESAARRLYDALFESSIVKSPPAEPSREAIEELRAIRECAADAPSASASRIVRAKSASAGPSKKFRPWAESGDACFILHQKDNRRLLFHLRGEQKDLCLRSDSHALNLMTFLASGSLRSEEIRDKLNLNETKPSKVITLANEILNGRVAEKGFSGVPANTEFIRRDKFGSYFSGLTIYACMDEFERSQREQPLVDDRWQNDLNADEDAFG